MAAYFFTRQSDASGRCELHVTTCPLASRHPRKNFRLGDHLTCESAVAMAHRIGTDVSRCHLCCAPANRIAPLPVLAKPVTLRRGWPTLRVA